MSKGRYKAERDCNLETYYLGK
uniref:Uncharacterized protein n=1 Tax=Anguilla anguilla TaxID=7936 RepID=A0A0E9T8M0_ANGAN